MSAAIRIAARMMADRLRAARDAEGPTEFGCEDRAALAAYEDALLELNGTRHLPFEVVP